MIEAKDRAMQFKSELKALLKKWNAEIGLEDIGRNWSYYYVIKCYIDAIYEDGDCIAEWTEVDLGRCVDGD